jgi:hypothetical protein
MKSKDQILLEDAYQKVLKEVVNSGEELPDLDMKMSTGNLDKLDKSNLYTQQDDREEENDSLNNQEDELSYWGKLMVGTEMEKNYLNNNKTVADILGNVIGFRYDKEENVWKDGFKAVSDDKVVETLYRIINRANYMKKHAPKLYENLFKEAETER